MPLPVQIVTDSTCNLPPELIAQYHIAQVPILVMFGNETFREGVDITPREFYDRVERTGVVPTTSQPAAGAFAEVYHQVAQRVDQAPARSCLSISPDGSAGCWLPPMRLPS
jgi:DegV family protein with EDD domain